MSAHATFAPSAAARWMFCHGSVQACAGLPDVETEHAKFGTACHTLAADCLSTGRDPAEAVGSTDERTGLTITDEMAQAVAGYVNELRASYLTTDALLEVEQRVSLSHVLGDGQFGTADALVLDGVTTLQVHDAKFGVGVKVDAEHNEQLMLYALGALREYELTAEIDTVLLVIHQPRLSHVSEWQTTPAELEDFAQRARLAMLNAKKPDAPRVPGERQCRWCAAKPTCPALAELVATETAMDFDDLDARPAEPDAGTPADALAGHMHHVDLVEQWCRAVRAEVERRLIAGQPVAGFKLVEGRRGARKWADEAAVEELLKGLRLKKDVMYDLKLISPTTAEKLKKAGTLGPRQWPRIEALITRAEGKPSVAPESDPRPALPGTVDDFSDLTKEETAA